MTGNGQETSEQPLPDADELLALASMRMPFGKYQGRLLIDLPEPYVVWFAKKGSLKAGWAGCCRRFMR